jgi:peptidoglycan/LPS O-acetylase OafA/YrhL
VRSEQPFYWLLAPFYEFGGYGVEVFWAISGFIFFWKYAAPIRAGAVGATRFFWLRFSRLYPLHLATLLLVAALQAIYFHRHGYHFVYPDNGWRSFGLQLFLGSHWLSPLVGYSFNGPIWSVSLEVLAYLFFYLWSRRCGAAWWSALAPLPVVYVVGKHFGLQQLECLEFFQIGCITAWIYQRAARWIDGVAVALLVGASLVQWRWPTEARIYLAYAVPAVIYLALRFVRPPAGLRRRIEALGDLTYSSYLLHFPLQLMVMIAFAWLGRPIPFYSPILFVGFIGVTFALSRPCYRRFEKPVQDAIRRRMLPVTSSARRDSLRAAT